MPFPRHANGLIHSKTGICPAEVARSALEDEDGHAASIVHVQGVLGLSGHIKGESFSHNNVPRGPELLVDLLLGVLAGSLDQTEE